MISGSAVLSMECGMWVLSAESPLAFGVSSWEKFRYKEALYLTARARAEC